MAGEYEGLWDQPNLGKSWLDQVADDEKEWLDGLADLIVTNGEPPSWQAVRRKYESLFGDRWVPATGTLVLSVRKLVKQRG